ncbi:MAG: hypothetical protein CME70_09050 [Halobacteriovorax sp.]|nr:hypothetical protein [Halobacteriovorax sp.]
MEKIDLEEHIYKPNHISIGLLSLLCTLVFLPSLYFDFFFLDDGFHVRDNPRIDLTWENFKWFWQKSDVPVVYNVWQLIGFIGQGEASAYRFANILLHLLNGIILFKVSYKLISKHGNFSKSVPFLISLIFLIHPLQVESVVWISSFRSTLAVFFMFLALEQYEKRLGLKNDILIILFYLAGILSKPIIGVLPLFLFVFDYFINKKPLKKILLAPYILLPGVFLIGYFFVVLLPKSVLETQLTLVQRLLVLVDSLYFYFLKSFFPLLLSGIYGKSLEQVISSFSSNSFLLTLIGFTLVLLGLTFISVRKKDRFMILGLAIFIIFYIPTSGIFNFDYQIISTVADRYMYLPIIGVSLIGIDLWQILKEKEIGVMINKLLNSLGIAFVVAMIFTSCRQVGLWQDEIKLLAPAGINNPDSYHVQLALGSQLINRGEPQRALKHLKRAYNLKNDSFEAALFLVQAYSQTIQLKKAKELLDLYRVESASFLPMIHSYLDGLDRAGKYQEAEDIATYYAQRYPYEFGITSRLESIKSGAVHRSLYALKKLLRSEEVKKNSNVEAILRKKIEEYEAQEKEILKRD